MTYKSIHAVASGAEDDAQVLKSAAELAALHGACLTVVSAFVPPAVQLAYAAPPGLYMDPTLIDELEKGHEDIKAQVRTDAEAAASHAGLAFGKDVVLSDFDSSAWGSTPHWLPLSELMILGPTLSVRDLAADLLLRARAPVLVARPELQLKPLNVAIAWDGSLSAGRAIRESLPLLKMAERILVLQQPEEIPAERRAAADAARLSDYLGRHGLDVVLETVPGHSDAGEGILEAVRCCSAEVLVCGAYGHSRLAETILGGVTRTVLHAAFPSAFLAH